MALEEQDKQLTANSCAFSWQTFPIWLLFSWVSTAQLRVKSIGESDNYDNYFTTESCFTNEVSPGLGELAIKINGGLYQFR